MNDLSYFFIMLFGGMFGFVFLDLLEELGLSKKMSHSWIAVIFLAFLSLLGFLIYPLAIFGVFTLNDLGLFYNQSGGVFMGLTLALLFGGGAHLAYHIFSEKK